MKKIILSTVFGALLSTGSVMAASVPDGGHAGGMEALIDGISLDQEDSLAAMLNGHSADRGREAGEDDIFLPAAYSYNDEDIHSGGKWMVQHTEQNGDGNPIPLPGTLLLLSSGVAGLFFIRRSSMHTA